MQTFAFTCQSTRTGLKQVIVHPPLQHLFYLFWAVVIKTFKAQLLAGLFACDEFSFYPQSPVCNFLPAIVAHFFTPNSSLSKCQNKYFFSRYLRSFTLLCSKLIGPIFRANICQMPVEITLIIDLKFPFSSFQVYSKQQVQNYSKYCQRYFFKRDTFQAQSTVYLRVSISLIAFRIYCLGFLMNLSIFQLKSTGGSSKIVFFSSSVSLMLVSWLFNLFSHTLWDIFNYQYFQLYQLQSSDTSESSSCYQCQELTSSSSSTIFSKSQSNKNNSQPKNSLYFLLQSFLIRFRLLFWEQFSWIVSNENQSMNSLISYIFRFLCKGVSINLVMSWSMGQISGVWYTRWTQFCLKDQKKLCTKVRQLDQSI